jgi:hypothetical protein
VVEWPRGIQKKLATDGAQMNTDEHRLTLMTTDEDNPAFLGVHLCPIGGRFFVGVEIGLNERNEIGSVRHPRQN